MWPGKLGVLTCGPTRTLHHFNMAQLQFAKLFYSLSLRVIPIGTFTYNRSDTWAQGKAICVLIFFLSGSFQLERRYSFACKRGSAEI